MNAYPTTSDTCINRSLDPFPILIHEEIGERIQGDGIEPPTSASRSARRSTAELPPVLHRNNGTSDNTFRTSARSIVGAHPMAINWPSNPPPTSMIGLCITPASRNRRSTALSAASLSTASATARVSGGRFPGDDSPAACTVWATISPSGRSRLRMT